MSELKSEMAFEVGEMVYHRQAIHNADHVPRQYVVTERSVVECHGGVQRFYRLHNIEGLHPEIALTREEPAYQKRSAAFYEEQDDATWREISCKMSRAKARAEASRMAAEDEGKEDNT